MGRSSMQGTPWHYETHYIKGRKKGKDVVAKSQRNMFFETMPDRIESDVSDQAREQFFRKPYSSENIFKEFPFCPNCKRKVKWMRENEGKKLICLFCGEPIDASEYREELVDPSDLIPYSEELMNQLKEKIRIKNSQSRSATNIDTTKKKRRKKIKRHHINF